MSRGVLCDECCEHLIPNDDGIFCHHCVKREKSKSFDDGVKAGAAAALNAIGRPDECKFCGADVWFVRRPWSGKRVNGWWIFGADGERHNCKENP